MQIFLSEKRWGTPYEAGDVTQPAIQSSMRLILCFGALSLSSFGALRWSLAPRGSLSCSRVAADPLIHRCVTSFGYIGISATQHRDLPCLGHDLNLSVCIQIVQAHARPRALLIFLNQKHLLSSCSVFLATCTQNRSFVGRSSSP